MKSHSRGGPASARLQVTDCLMSLMAPVRRVVDTDLLFWVTIPVMYRTGVRYFKT
jgi:hypothetical protein